MKLGGRPISPDLVSLSIKQAQALERALRLTEQPSRSDAVGAVLRYHEVDPQGTVPHVRKRILVGTMLFVPEGHHNARFHGHVLPEDEANRASLYAEKTWETFDQREWAGRPCFAQHERAMVPCADGYWDLTHRSVFEVTCPMCGAEQGEPCIQFDGPRPGTYMRRDHRPRRVAYYKHRGIPWAE